MSFKTRTKHTIITMTLLMGILFTTTIIHEIIHYIDADQPESLCIDFGQDSFMHLSYKANKQTQPISEAKAYLIQLAITIPLIALTMKYRLKELEKELQKERENDNNQKRVLKNP